MLKQVQRALSPTLSFMIEKLMFAAMVEVSLPACFQESLVMNLPPTMIYFREAPKDTRSS